MDTTFQTQTQNSMQMHDEGFLKGLRVIPLSLAITAFLFIQMIQTVLFGSLNFTMHFVSMVLYNITFAFASVVIMAHTLKGEKAKTLGIVTLIGAAVTLLVSLTQNTLWFAECNNDGIATVLQIIRLLSSLTTFVALVIGCDKKYRLWISLLIASTLIGGIKGFLPHTFLNDHFTINLIVSILVETLFFAGFAGLLYHGLVSPAKHEPSKQAIESEKFNSSVLMKVINCCAAAFLFIYIVIATFYKPEADTSYGFTTYEEFMPSGGYFFEIVLLLLLTNLVIFGIKFKTLATKIMSFCFAGLLLTLNIVIIAAMLIQEPQHFNILFGFTNLLQLCAYAFLMIILFWIAKAQTTGIARKVFAMSTACFVAGISATHSLSLISAMNYNVQEYSYIPAVLIILATFITLPWLIFQLLTSSWPKVRPLFFAIPIMALMLIFIIIRLNMNGSWEKKTDYSSYDFTSTETTTNEETPEIEDYDSYGSSDDSYDSDEYVEVDSMPEYEYDENY